jgi:TRAP-type C4-dicarboxylate transport system permease small subunit
VCGKTLQADLFGRNDMSSSTSEIVRLLVKAVTKCNKVLVFVASLVLIAIACMLTYDVCRRYFFNAPLPASVEISSLLQAWVVFLPFAFTLAVGQHVRVTIVTTHLGKTQQRHLVAITHIITGVVCLVLTWYAWEEFSKSYAVNEIMMAPVIVYWWIGKIVGPLGMAIFGFQAFVLAAEELTSQKEGD